MDDLTLSLANPITSQNNVTVFSSEYNVEKIELKCEECGKEFVKFDTHLENNHNVGQKCIDCETASTQHELIANNQTEETCECVHCGKVAPASNVLNSHLYLYTDIPYECEQCEEKIKKWCEGSKSYECENCGEKFQDQSTLKKHLRSKHKQKKSYECEYCAKTFSNNYNLKRHTRIHTEKNDVKLTDETKSQISKIHLLKQDTEKRFECENCGKSFVNGSSLKKHMRIHTGETPYQCDDCGKMFSYSNTLKIHLRIHTGEKPYECKDCGQKFREQSTMKKHFRSKHTNERPHECEYCAKSFSHSYSLKMHMRIHTGENLNVTKFKRNKRLRKPNAEKRYQCEHCGKKFADNGGLKTHLRMHNGELPFVCEYCGKKFSQVSGLTAHLRVHTKELPYECNECGKKFSQSSHVKRHMMTHTKEKPHQCELCGKSFQDRTTLKVHFRIHTGEKPYECGHCGKTFNQRSSWRSHLKLHTSESPFQCQYCNKRMKDSSNLKKHLEIHIGDMPHECEECGNKYKLKGSLNRHIRKKHCTENELEKSMRVESHSENFSEESSSSEGEDFEQEFSECQHCDEIFLDSRDLKMHLKTHTEEDMPYECEECGNKYKLKGALNKHLKKEHYKEKERNQSMEFAEEGSSEDEECEQQLGTTIIQKLKERQHCDEEFIESDDLKSEHLTTYTEKLKEHEHCDEVFTEMNDLKDNSTAYTEKLKEHQLSDEISEESSDLKIHLMTNTEKINESQHCKEIFKESSDLKIHLKVHTDEQTSSNTSNLISDLLPGEGKQQFTTQLANKEESHSKQKEITKTNSLETNRKTCNNEETKNTDSKDLKMHSGKQKEDSGENSINCDSLMNSDLKTHTNEKDEFSCQFNQHGQKPNLTTNNLISDLLPGNSKQPKQNKEINDTEFTTQLREKEECESEVNKKDINIKSLEANWRTCNEDEICKEIKYTDSNGMKIHTDEMDGFSCQYKQNLLAGSMVHYEDNSSNRCDELYRYQCEHCGKTLKLFIHLKAHLRMHTGIKSHRCSRCRMRFKNIRSLKRHFRSQHARKGLHDCEHCGLKYKTKCDLNKHLIVHLGKYECQFCGQKYIQRRSFKKHLTLHTVDKLYECEYCEKKLTDEKKLKKHLLIHTSGEEHFMCEHCGIKFSFEFLLKIHLRVHTGESPYKCKTCRKKFTTVNELIAHLRT
ncbi:uncharacterized protein [Antedon mediterranea]|uniref:uncharacterized protein n=1 Tax=Antedon mediterranea TaxID=105859 RepID=UPI003AF48569